MRVLAPASVIGTFDGVELIVLSIELWPSVMVVHAACLESEPAPPDEATRLILSIGPETLEVPL